MGLVMAVAIAIHNIPEGIAISVPIYYATENRKKAFTYSFLSALSEPIGAALGAVGGFMVFTCFDELLPIAIKYGDEHLMLSGLLSGMLVMAASPHLLGLWGFRTCFPVRSVRISIIKTSNTSFNASGRINTHNYHMLTEKHSFVCIPN